MARTFFVLLIFIIAMGGVIWLQIRLSKKDSKWFGLILPILSFCLSLIITLGAPAHQLDNAINMQTFDENNELISESVTDENQSQNENVSSNIVGLVYTSTFFICNIPTIVLLAIFFSIKEKKRQQLALEKMRVQDLE